MHRLVVLVALLIWGPLGCGDDSEGGSGHMVDPDDEDAGPPMNVIDASAPPPIRPDSGTVPPGEPDPGLGGGCAVDSNKVHHLAMSGTNPPSMAALSVDRIESRFGLAYIDASPDCLDAVFLSELHGAPGTVEPEEIKLIDHCSDLEDVALAHNQSHWLVAVTDSWMGAADVWIHNADPEATATLPSHRITDDANRNETKLSLTTWGDAGAMVAWVQTTLDGSESQLMVRALDPEGAPTADAVEIDRVDANTVAAAFNSVTIRAVGNSNVLLAYHKLESMSDGKSFVMLRTLDRTGVPLREAWVLTENAPEDAGVDVAAGIGDDVRPADSGDGEIRTERGGAMVWTERIASTGLQVWLQAIGPDGEAARLQSAQTGEDLGPAPTRRLVNSPLRAIDASITRTPRGDGFAVAYRALVGGPVDAPRIRVMFLNKVGDPQGNSDVAYTSDWGGRTAIQSSLDGRYTIGWNELDEADQTVTTLIQLPCSG